jgi:hypothetical protein
MIAATAHLHGLTVATRNERDFARFPLASSILSSIGRRSSVGLDQDFVFRATGV